MKIVLLTVILFSCFSSFAQEYNMFMRDSLIVALKVKTRMTIIGGYREDRYLVDYFNEKGMIIQAETRDAYSDSPMIRTVYFYDKSDRVDSSILYNVGSFGLIKNSMRGETRYMITTYKYHNDELVGSETRDDQGMLNYRSVFNPDSSFRVTESYNNAGKPFKGGKYLFDSKANLVKSITFELNEQGEKLNVIEQSYTNTFNSKGQLETVEYINGGRRCTRRYKYYKNGLRWLKKADRCSGKWEFKYTYY